MTRPLSQPLSGLGWEADIDCYYYCYYIIVVVFIKLLGKKKALQNGVFIKPEKIFFLFLRKMRGRVTSPENQHDRVLAADL